MNNLETIAQLLAENMKYKQALKTVARWEFPPSGRVWEKTGEVMSYASAYGSNGERDYMRKIAVEALDV